MRNKRPILRAMRNTATRGMVAAPIVTKGSAAGDNYSAEQRLAAAVVSTSMLTPQAFVAQQAPQGGDNCWWTETGWQCCTHAGSSWPSCVAGGVTFHQKHSGVLPPAGSYEAAVAAGVYNRRAPVRQVTTLTQSNPNTITQQLVRMAAGSPWLLDGLAVPVTSNIVPPQVTGGKPRAWVRIYPDAAQPKIGSWWKGTLYRNWGATAEAVLVELPTTGNDGLLRARAIPMPQTAQATTQIGGMGYANQGASEERIKTSDVLIVRSREIPFVWPAAVAPYVTVELYPKPANFPKGRWMAVWARSDLGALWARPMAPAGFTSVSQPFTNWDGTQWRLAVASNG